MQAGAFASRDRADALAASLLMMGEARVVPNGADPPFGGSGSVKTSPWTSPRSLQKK